MTTPYFRIRLLVADDHELDRQGLYAMISELPELEWVGHAVNGKDLVALTDKYLPDVILTDVKMPELSGIEATAIIKQKHPHIGILALSSFDEENLIMDMLNAGANGYLLKNAGKKEIADAVKAAFKGETYYCKEANEKLTRVITGHYFKKKNETESFSERELQVIALICEGMPSKVIAARLGLKTRTVERYRDTIMHKMEVNNSAGMVLYAVTHGLYSQPIDKK
jgi:DNA-binding NarL/FixJ family response regulator